MTEVIHKAEISNATRKMRDGASDMKSAVYNQGRDVYNQARDKGADVFNRARSKSEHTIQDYPYHSVLVGFGLGVLLGAIFTRR